MKFSGVDAETLCGGGPVDTLLLTTCWGGTVGGIGGSGGATGGGGGDFLMDTPSHKLVMDSTNSCDEDSATKATMDALDNLLLSSSQSSPPGSNNNFAELKPLPPFTGYTGHLSINGISGHHYHAIAQPPSPQSPRGPSSMAETNNNNTHATNHNTNNNNNNVVYKGGNATLYYTVSTTADHPVVSSSTMDAVVKSEFVDYSSLLAPDIEDIAAIIGSAIADTTVPSVDGMGGGAGGAAGEDNAVSRDSWMDLEALIETACENGSVLQGGHKAIISAESLQEFVANSQFVVSPSPEPTGGPSSTLQNLLTQSQQGYQQQLQMMKREPSTTTGYHMPLLQSRLQNGPPNGAMKPEPSYMSECPSPSSSTSYLNREEMILPHTTTGSPPGHVVSTTDNSMLMNGRYQHRGNGRATGYGQMRTMKITGIPSPDLLVNGGSLDGLGGGGMYPHTTTASTTTPSKSKSRSRSNRNKQQQCPGGAASVVYSSDGTGGLLGKEKPVHRCTICNRGFLNKSNIKVHLRTHTGEKPFRCEVCGKAFRQKAHLIKHQQIHKRVGRD